MIYIAGVLVLISFIVVFILSVIVNQERVKLQRLASIASIPWREQKQYLREYVKLRREHSSTIRLYFIWLAILVINLITGYILL
jgi:hypothetical protein